MRWIRPLLLGCCLALGALAPRPAQATPTDPPAARELLKQGYALKVEGRYSEALVSLEESLRLDSQLKTLINIADCEEHLGRLTRAQQHWVLAREQASAQGAGQFSAEIEKRLAALEARMPRLTVNRAGPPVDGTEVRRDGVLLGVASTGVALPTDPGTHTIVVTAPGRSESRYLVELVENDAKVLEVAVGPALEVAAPIEGRPEPARSAAPVAASKGPQPGFWNAQRGLAIGAAGLGLGCFGVAAVAWARANSQHAEAASTCNPSCTEHGRQLQADAVENAHLTNAMLATGGVLVVGGGVLWLTAPGLQPSASLELVPMASASEGGILVTGTF